MTIYKQLEMNMFIDWDKYNNCFYNNLYLKDYKIVVKITLIPGEKSKGYKN